MIAHLYTLLLRWAAPPEPVNGPSGGLSWLRGYTPRFDYQPARRRPRNKRDELLFLK